MNKKLLAAALGLAFAAPAFADSSNVVLYGRVHETLEHSKTSSAAGPNLGQGFAMRDVASRLGVKGSEDLGGGLSAIFAYEFSVAADNNVGVGGRHSYVGFKSESLGTLVFGRQDGGNDSVAPLYNQASAVAYSVSNNGGRLQTIDGTASFTATTAANARTQRISNAIGYSTKVAGVQIDARHALTGTDNNVGATTNQLNNENSIRSTELAATYSAGAFTVGAGVEYFGYSDGQKQAAGAGSKKSLYQLTGSYDFGVAKVGLVYGRLNLNSPFAGQSDDSRTDYRLSAWAPLSANTGLVASYGRADLLANGSLKSKTMQVAGYYDFSKRTRVYAGINQNKQDVVTSSVDTKTTDVVVGLRHNF